MDTLATCRNPVLSEVAGKQNNGDVWSSVAAKSTLVQATSGRLLPLALANDGPGGRPLGRSGNPNSRWVGGSMDLGGENVGSGLGDIKTVTACGRWSDQGKQSSRATGL